MRRAHGRSLCPSNTGARVSSVAIRSAVVVMPPSCQAGAGPPIRSAGPPGSQAVHGGEPGDGVVDDLVALAEREPDVAACPRPGRRRTPPAARRRRRPGGAGPGRTPCRRAAPTRPDVGHDEVGALRAEHPEAGGLQPGAQPVPLVLQIGAQPEHPVELGPQRQRDRRLERCPADVGEELLHRAHRGDQRRRAAGPADLPAGRAERLSRRWRSSGCARPSRAGWRSGCARRRRTSGTRRPRR